jgi:hypothetical protein
MSTHYQPTFDEPPFVEALPDTEAYCAGDENTWQENLTADALTVAARKKGSAFAASFNAVFRRSGIPEACRKLDLDLNEIKALYLTMIDAAQRAEYEAESAGVPFSKRRRFKCAAYMMECFHKRVLPPLDLTPEEKEKWINSRARQWRRRFDRVHLAQCFTHLPFFVAEKGVADAKQKQASHYIDHLTDVVSDTAMRAARMRGEPINRYNRAADEALAAFRETVKPYAPEWTLYDQVDDAPKPAAAPKIVDPWKQVKRAAREMVKEALRVVREQGLTPEQAIARRMELQAEIETAWTREKEPPDTPEDGNAPEEATPPVTSNPLSPCDTTTDTPEMDAPPTNLDRTPVSYLNHEETQNHSANLQTVSGVGATNFSNPADEARLAVEAFESVGCKMFKAVFVGIYPLNGEAENLGSEPKQKGASITGAEIKPRLPEYIKRNQEQGHNVAVRAWGAIIQVDDCTAEIMERLKPFAFLITETSPGNYQVWLALPKSFTGADGKISAEGKALRTRLLKKFEERGEFANGGAWGSTRLPGTLNIKEKYQSSFPRIQLSYVALGRITTPEELEAAGLLAAAPVRPVTMTSEPPRYSNSKLSTVWPNHQDYVNRAPLNDQGKPDLSRADESFAVRCLALGHPRYSVGAKLRTLRDKAANRADYVERTLNAAESWLASQPVQNGRERITI